MSYRCSKCGAPKDAKTGMCPRCTPPDLFNTNNAPQNPYEKPTRYNAPPQYNQPHNAPPQYNNQPQPNQYNAPVPPPVQYAPQGFVQPQPQKSKGAFKDKKFMTIIIAIVIVFGLLLGMFGIVGYINGKNSGGISDSYSEILSRYERLANGELDEDDVDDHRLSRRLISKLNRHDDYVICYATEDINGDEIEEFIVGGHEEDSGYTEIYDIYTTDDGVAEQLYDLNEFNKDTQIEIYGDVIKVFYEDSGNSWFEYNTLPENDVDIDVIVSYVQEGDKYYEIVDDERKEISKSDFEEADEQFEGEELDLDWVSAVIKDDHKYKDIEVDDEKIDSTEEPETTETTTEKEETTTTRPEAKLTDAQKQSFNKLVNDMGYMVMYREEHSNKIDTIVKTFVYSSFWAIPDGTMYSHYFPSSYKLIKEVDYNRTYEMDAEKVLFITNDVFGLNLTNSYEGNGYYFKNDKFYYTQKIGAMGDEIWTEHEVVSYEPRSDGYFKIQTKVTQYEMGEFIGASEAEYYIAKPATHPKYGDYWKIKEYGYKNEVIWSN